MTSWWSNHLTIIVCICLHCFSQFCIFLLHFSSILVFFPIERRSTRKGRVTMSYSWKIFKGIIIQERPILYNFVLACWMAAIQGYGRLCWHFCSVDEWLQPQLQQPWSLARKVCVGFGRCRPHHESKAHSGTSCCKRFISMLSMLLTYDVYTGTAGTWE